MMFATPCEDYEVDPVIAKALDLLLILHADHEQNCSTSTVRLVGSSRANLFACISAGHQRARGARSTAAPTRRSIEMLERIAAEGGDGQSFVERAKDKKDNSAADGLRPPRLQELRPARGDPEEACTEVLDKLGAPEPAARDRDAARGDRAEGRVLHQPQALPERRLLLGRHLQGDRHPGEHVHGDVRDRPPARLDRAVDRDARSDPDIRIGRPRQIYTGATQRHYVPIDAAREPRRRAGR